MVMFYQDTGQEAKGCSDYADNQKLERQQRRAADVECWPSEVRWRLATFYGSQCYRPRSGSSGLRRPDRPSGCRRQPRHRHPCPESRRGQANVAAGNEFCINGGDRKAVVAHVVDGASALELYLWSGNHQPITRVGVEVQISSAVVCYEGGTCCRHCLSRKTIQVTAKITIIANTIQTIAG
jgi:hypothetical protein